MKKDSEEYFKIRYYLIGEEKGEGIPLMSLKLFRNWVIKRFMETWSQPCTLMGRTVCQGESDR